MRKNNNNKGFLLIEVIVAFSIMSLSVIAAMWVSQKSIAVSRQALHTASAGFLLEEGAEAVRIVRDNAWTNISSLTNGTNYYPTFSGGTWTLSTTANTVGIFTRMVTVASVSRDVATSDISSSGTNDPGTKLVTVTVSWVEGNTTISKTLQFYITNLFS